MAKQLQQWLETEVQPFRDKSVAWLSQLSLFPRPYAPDVCGRELLFRSRGWNHHLSTDGAAGRVHRAAQGQGLLSRGRLARSSFDAPSLVIGIFMTFFDVHVNRMGERNHE